MFRRIATKGFSCLLVLSCSIGISACGSDAPPAPAAAVANQGPFQPSGAVPAIQLDRIEGNYELPLTNLPSSLNLEEDVEEFVLTKIREHKRPNDNQSRRRNPLWLARLPFHVPETSKRFKPIGMRVTIDGKDVPFSTSSAVGAGGASWRIANQDLVIARRTEPKAGTVKIFYPTMREKIDRLAVGTSGLEAFDFMKWEYQVKDRTRRGMMLPSSSTVEADTTNSSPSPDSARPATSSSPPWRTTRSIPRARDLTIISSRSPRANSPPPDSTSPVHGTVLGPRRPRVKCSTFSRASGPVRSRLGSGAPAPIRPEKLRLIRICTVTASATAPEAVQRITLAPLNTVLSRCA